jgi:hypothetical protein
MLNIDLSSPGIFWRCALCIPLVLVCVMVFSCGMGTTAADPPTAPMTLEELFRWTGLPAQCNAPVAWEGHLVTVTAMVDAANIFDKRGYPRLPYEKFRLFDGHGRSLEVWPQAADNQPIFDKLARRTGDTIVVTGRLKAVKLPTAGQCLLGIKVVIDDASRIEF